MAHTLNEEYVVVVCDGPQELQDALNALAPNEAVMEITETESNYTLIYTRFNGTTQES